MQMMQSAPVMHMISSAPTVQVVQQPNQNMQMMQSAPVMQMIPSAPTAGGSAAESEDADGAVSTTNADDSVHSDYAIC